MHGICINVSINQDDNIRQHNTSNMQEEEYTEFVDMFQFTMTTITGKITRQTPQYAGNRMHRICINVSINQDNNYQAKQHVNPPNMQAEE